MWLFSTSNHSKGIDKHGIGNTIDIIYTLALLSLYRLRFIQSGSTVFGMAHLNKFKTGFGNSLVEIRIFRLTLHFNKQNLHTLRKITMFIQFSV